MRAVICFQSVIFCLHCNSGEPHRPANSFAASDCAFALKSPLPIDVVKLTQYSLLALLEELMTRLRVDRITVVRIIDRLTVPSKIDRLMVASRIKCLAVASGSDWNSISRSILALLVSFSLLTTPVWAAPSSSLGTVVYADRAHVGAARASVGSTVFSGDRLSTEQTGTVQVRAGAARLLLSSASSATFSQDDANPAAPLTAGPPPFSSPPSTTSPLPIASPLLP